MLKHAKNCLSTMAGGPRHCAKRFQVTGGWHIFFQNTMVMWYVLRSLFYAYFVVPFSDSRFRNCPFFPWYWRSSIPRKIMWARWAGESTLCVPLQGSTTCLHHMSPFENIPTYFVPICHAEAWRWEPGCLHPRTLEACASAVCLGSDFVRCSCSFLFHY